MAISTSSRTPPPAPRAAVIIEVTMDMISRNMAGPLPRLSGIRVRFKGYIQSMAEIGTLQVAGSTQRVSCHLHIGDIVK